MCPSNQGWPSKRNQARRVTGAPDLISVRIGPGDLTGGSSIRANPAAVGIPEAACAIDADAVADTAAPASAAAATNDNAAATTKASATATAETTTATETTAAAAATATTATATATAGVSRRARCGQHQRRSADDAEAVNADQGKRCQPACEKIARGILSHLYLPVGEAVRLYGFFCRRACQGVFRMRAKIKSYRRTRAGTLPLRAGYGEGARSVKLSYVVPRRFRVQKQNIIAVLLCSIRS